MGQDDALLHINCGLYDCIQINLQTNLNYLKLFDFSTIDVLYITGNFGHAFDIWLSYSIHLSPVQVYFLSTGNVLVIYWVHQRFYWTAFLFCLRYIIEVIFNLKVSVLIFQINIKPASILNYPFVAEYMSPELTTDNKKYSKMSNSRIHVLLCITLFSMMPQDSTSNCSKTFLHLYLLLITYKQWNCKIQEQKLVD